MTVKSLRHLAAALIAASLTTGAGAQTLSDSNLEFTGLRTSGTLSRPIAFVFLNNTGTDFLIAEQATGQVKRMTNGVVSSTIALDLAVNLGSLSERGLLCLVADPQFATNGYVYVYYSPSSTSSDTTANASIGSNHIVARYTWNSVNGLLENRTVIQSDLPITGGPNHNGGVMVFGPPSAAPADQKLFIIIGDLNRNNQNENYPSGLAPDGSANVLRINSDGTIPTDNPFYNVPGANSYLQRMYAYGIRNSFGMTFDPLSTPNNLWDTENGTNDYDEINLVAPSFNSGWEYWMGPQSRGFHPTQTGGLTQYGGLGTYSDPEFSFRVPPALAAIYFVDGNGLGPDYYGDCIVADYNNARLYKFEMNAQRSGFVFNSSVLQDLVYDSADSGSLSEILFGTNFGGITSMKTGADGKLYAVSLGGNQIYRIQRKANLPTPSPTPSPSPSSTPSLTPSASPSPSVSPSATPSLSPTETATPSPTASPTASATPTVSPSATPSPTPWVITYPTDFINAAPFTLEDDDLNTDGIVDCSDITPPK
ncbi:MAG TPA: PQQ-dependent sugar dehydrogenase [Candidatus Sumerlaeota bacterium]|nr:PQQ-dependent sugar dehydrogenase [Candidatus Sumerlaeota bacterium]